MADKVKLTPPMTDSKTPEWAMAAADDVWTALANNEANGREAEMALFSHSLLSAYERGRKEGIEEAAKVVIKQAPATQDWADAPLQDQAKRTATAIRQLLEVKG